MEAPLDNLSRTFDFALSRDAIDGDGLTLEGYAAVFDQETVIDSWEGNFVEKIARGAFKKTIRESTPVVQFDHGRHPLVGSIPIAAPPALREDDRGLFMTTRLHDNWLTEPVRDAVRSGAIPGQSFRFTVTKEKWDDPADAQSLPVRTIQEIRLYELGPVVFPAYTGTTVGTRSQEALSLAADPDFRRELARALVFGTPEGAADRSEPLEEHSDEPDTPEDEAAPDEEGTSEEEAVRSEEEPPEPRDAHSEDTYTPTERPRMSDRHRERALEDIREMVAAASAKDI